MKKLINPIKQLAIIAFVFALLTSCKDGQVNTQEITEYKSKIETYEKEIKELKARLEEVGSHRRPDNIIQSDFAKEIYHLYDKREALINEVVGQDGENKPFKATRSLFYDINDLQQYLRYVKKLSRKAQVQPSGFRFYYALYPDTYLRDDKDKKYAKRQTFFIAPTKAVKDAAGNIEHLGYTLDNNFKVELLREKIGLDSRLGADGKTYQTGSFFNFSLSSFEEDNSLIANEIHSSPPEGKK